MNTQARFSWKDAPDLMDRLTSAQNSPAHENHDIMTFAGFMTSREELQAYVESNEERAQ